MHAKYTIISAIALCMTLPTLYAADDPETFNYPTRSKIEGLLIATPPVTAPVIQTREVDLACEKNEPDANCLNRSDKNGDEEADNE